MLDIGTTKFNRCVITQAIKTLKDNHLDNISGIRTRAVEILNVFEMKFRWEKDIEYYFCS